MTRTTAFLFGILSITALAGGCSRSSLPTSAAGDPAPGAPAADTVALKPYRGKVGDRIKTTRESKTTTTSVLTFLGERKESVEKGDEATIYVTEVVTVDAASGVPVKLKRTFEKADRQVAGRTTKLPLDGKTVVIEKKGDTFAFTYEDGGAVTGASLAFFSGEFNRVPGTEDIDLFFPAGAQKSGASWDVKAAYLKGYEKPFLFDHDKTTATAKLVKTYAADGKQFGVLEIQVESPLTGIDGFPKGAIRPGSGLKHEWKTDGCIDGSAPTRTTVYTLRGRTVLENDAEVRDESVTTRKVELLPKP